MHVVMSSQSIFNMLLHYFFQIRLMNRNKLINPFMKQFHFNEKMVFSKNEVGLEKSYSKFYFKQKKYIVKLEFLLVAIFLFNNGLIN